MKYVLTIVQNESVSTCFIFGKKKEAKARFYHEMEYAANANLTCMCTISDMKGNLVISDTYTAEPQVNPDPESGEE